MIRQSVQIKSFRDCDGDFKCAHCRKNGGVFVELEFTEAHVSGREFRPMVDPEPRKLVLHVDCIVNQVPVCSKKIQAIGGKFYYHVEPKITKEEGDTR